MAQGMGWYWACRGQARTVWLQGARRARYLDGARWDEGCVVPRPWRQHLEPHAIL